MALSLPGLGIIIVDVGHRYVTHSIRRNDTLGHITRSWKTTRIHLNKFFFRYSSGRIRIYSLRKQVQSHFN